MGGARCCVRNGPDGTTYDRAVGTRAFWSSNTIGPLRLCVTGDNTGFADGSAATRPVCHAGDR